ncbi:tRNA1(Val) (adenine(37)-N6)-methyltransferase [Haploplasma axanthum]|uniref:Methyltransferase n=1 Tax=Haploplasma axanthum TaxID=29552 RepID=A0A449BCU8_HAPAX|nr:methyltransferase [Haploplasma axanthum]VEU80160.1 methyltransferase [Haploplasma axanthum]
MKHFVETKRFSLNQTKEQAFNTDTILLANYIKIPKDCKNILDVGTGSGVLMFDLACKTKANIYGIEVQENRYFQALENIELNNKKEQLNVFYADFKEHKFDQLFDLIITNPPFFKVHNNKQLSQNEEDLIARHEIMLTLDELLFNVSKNLKYRGHFYMIHRPDRLIDIIEIASKYKLQIKKVRFIHPYIDKPANHILIMAIKNGGNGIIVDEPLILYKDKHVFTDEMIRIIGDF